MKNNTKVKVKVDNVWRFGTLIDDKQPSLYSMLVGIGEKHYFNYEEKLFMPQDVKEYVELSEEDAKAIHAKELPLAFQMTQEAVAALMPKEKVEIIEGSISFHGMLTLDPVTFDQETLGQIVEMAGWQVTYWKYYYATRNQPEELVDCPVGDPFNNYIHAVQLFIEKMFGITAAAYWQTKGDEQFAKMLEPDVF